MISGLVDKAWPALTNAGPNSTSKSVNSFALNLACFSNFNLPVNLSHPIENIKANIGIRVCHSLLKSLLGFF